MEKEQNERESKGGKKLALNDAEHDSEWCRMHLQPLEVFEEVATWRVCGQASRQKETARKQKHKSIVVRAINFEQMRKASMPYVYTSCWHCDRAAAAAEFSSVFEQKSRTKKKEKSTKHRARERRRRRKGERRRGRRRRRRRRRRKGRRRRENDYPTAPTVSGCCELLLRFCALDLLSPLLSGSSSFPSSCCCLLIPSSLLSFFFAVIWPASARFSFLFLCFHHHHRPPPPCFFFLLLLLFLSFLKIVIIFSFC